MLFIKKEVFILSSISPGNVLCVTVAVEMKSSDFSLSFSLFRLLYHLISIILQMFFFTFNDSYMIVNLIEFPWLAYRFPVGPWVVMSCLFNELDNIMPGAIQYANKQLTWPLDKVPLGIPLQLAQQEQV